MTAYSFKARFIPLIIAGTKRQTIRADRKNHAQEGGALQLYTAMRTKQCRLIGRTICAATMPITLDLDCGRVEFGSGRVLTEIDEIDAFAVLDGFEDWKDMLAFWRKEHGDISRFSGVLILWSFDAFAPASLAEER